MQNVVSKYTGLLQCFWSVGVKEGSAGLYGGLTVHIMRSIPSGVTTLGVYDLVLRFVGS